MTSVGIHELVQVYPEYNNYFLNLAANYLLFAIPVHIAIQCIAIDNFKAILAQYILAQ